MDSFQTDWLVVLIAAILNKVISFFWYSEWLFGPAWKKLCQMKEKDMKAKRWQPLFYSFIVSLVIAYFLSFFEGHLGITNVSDGMFVGFLFWLGFVATTQISPVIWCKKPFKLFAIDSGCKLLSFLVMSGIIGA